MNKYIVLTALFFIVVPGISVTNADIRHGLWRIETSIDMPGMAMKLPPQRKTFCINKENYVPRDRKVKKDCKYNQERDGNSFSWHMTCTKPKMVQKGSIKYAGRRMRGSLETTTYHRGRKALTTVKLNGQYLGSCKK